MPRSTSRPFAALLFLVILGGGACRPGEEASVRAGQALAAETGAAARLRRYEGQRVLEVPRFGAFEPEDELADRMRLAWAAAGENPGLFELRFGERVLSTDVSFDAVREFYLPYVSQVFMDHEMDFPGLGRQRMFTALIEESGGSLVKLTLTRPFYVYPTSQPVDRTFLQIGRTGLRPNPQDHFNEEARP